MHPPPVVFLWLCKLKPGPKPDLTPPHPGPSQPNPCSPADGKMSYDDALRKAMGSKYIDAGPGPSPASSTLPDKLDATEKGSRASLPVGESAHDGVAFHTGPAP